MVTTTTPKLSKVDREALTRAIELAKESGEYGRREQILHMLEYSGWQETGRFAAYGQQMRALGLKPWEWPPCWIRAGDRNPEHAAAAALLKRLRDAGLSQFEPNPVAALARLRAAARGVKVLLFPTRKR